MGHANSKYYVGWCRDKEHSEQQQLPLPTEVGAEILSYLPQKFLLDIVAASRQGLNSEAILHMLAACDVFWHESRFESYGLDPMDRRTWTLLNMRCSFLIGLDAIGPSSHRRDEGQQQYSRHCPLPNFGGGGVSKLDRLLYEVTSSKPIRSSMTRLRLSRVSGEEEDNGDHDTDGAVPPPSSSASEHDEEEEEGSTNTSLSTLPLCSSTPTASVCPHPPVPWAKALLSLRPTLVELELCNVALDVKTMKLMRSAFTSSPRWSHRKKAPMHGPAALRVLKLKTCPYQPGVSNAVFTSRSLTDAPFPLLDTITTFTSLEELYIDGGRHDVDNATASKTSMSTSLALLKNLKVLRLSTAYTKRTHWVSDGRLREIAQLPSLTSLELHHLPAISDYGMGFLAELTSSPTRRQEHRALKKLSLNGCSRITDDGILRAFPLPTTTTNENSATSTKPTDNVMNNCDDVTQICQNTALEHLELWFCKITSVGVHRLALTTGQTLRTLDLKNCFYLPAEGAFIRHNGPSSSTASFSTFDNLVSLSVPSRCSSNFLFTLSFTSNEHHTLKHLSCSAGRCAPLSARFFTNTLQSLDITGDDGGGVGFFGHLVRTLMAAPQQAYGDHLSTRCMTTHLSELKLFAVCDDDFDIISMPQQSAPATTATTATVGRIMFPHLRQLTIDDGCRLTDKGVRHLAVGLGHSLRQLIIGFGGNFLTDLASEHIANHMKFLEVLSLPEVTDDAILEHISRLPRLAKFECLYPENISPEVFEALRIEHPYIEIREPDEEY